MFRPSLSRLLPEDRDTVAHLRDSLNRLALHLSECDTAAVPNTEAIISDLAEIGQDLRALGLVEVLPEAWSPPITGANSLAYTILQHHRSPRSGAEWADQSKWVKGGPAAVARAVRIFARDLVEQIAPEGLPETPTASVQQAKATPEEGPIPPDRFVLGAATVENLTADQLWLLHTLWHQPERTISLKALSKLYSERKPRTGDAAEALRKLRERVNNMLDEAGARHEIERVNDHYRLVSMRLE